MKAFRPSVARIGESTERARDVVAQSFELFLYSRFLASVHVLHAKDSNNGFLALETRLVLNHFDGALVEHCGLGDISAGSQLKVKAITVGS